MSDNWQGNDDAQGHTISLSVEINIESPLMEECVAQTVRSLRLADRIERGEEIGWFDCLPEETEEIG